MLYIRRKTADNMYGIVDTDDNTETLVSVADIERMCCSLGIKINGVVLGTKNGANVIKSINIYNPQSRIRRIKYSVLSGLVIKVQNDELVSFNIDKTAFHKGTRIRLSEIASSCGKYAFKGMSYCDFGKLGLTIILDDNIKLNRYSLVDIFTRGIMLDVTEVTSWAVIDYVASEINSTVYTSSFDLEKSDSCLIASRLVRDYCVAMFHVNKRFYPQIKYIGEVVQDHQKVSELVANKYRSEFKKLAKSKLELSRNLRLSNDEEARNFISWITKRGTSILDGDALPETYMDDNFLYLFSSLESDTTLNTSSLCRLYNYVREFDYDEEIMKCYIALVTRMGRWVLHIYQDGGFATVGSKWVG